MRAFIGLWPSVEVLDTLDSLRRPDHPSLRWTTRAQWHVTLRFLGDVDDAEVPALGSALAEVARRHDPASASIGPRTRRIGSRLLVVPVDGVDDLAASVVEATAGIGPAHERRRFQGHLTLARAKGRRTIPAAVAGEEISGSWTVDELTLVRSHLEPVGARYETIATAQLGRA